MADHGIIYESVGRPLHGPADGSAMANDNVLRAEDEVKIRSVGFAARRAGRSSRAGELGAKNVVLRRLPRSRRLLCSSEKLAPLGQTEPAVAVSFSASIGSVESRAKRLSLTITSQPELRSRDERPCGFAQQAARPRSIWGIVPMKEMIGRRSAPRTIAGHSALILLHRRELYTCDVLDRTDRGARLDVGVLAFELHPLSVRAE
jgi:hypothetical protein